MTIHDESQGMTDTRESKSRSTRTSYSPQHRTALVLTGTGTSGAYHAGVLRALHEAGVKIDVIGANGIGVVGALFAAMDVRRSSGMRRVSGAHRKCEPSILGTRRIVSPSMRWRYRS